MIINLSPQRRDDMKIESISVIGDSIFINGEDYDFSDISEGGTISGFISIPNEFFAGEVGRKDGEIYINLLLPHGPNPSQSVSFPEPIHVTVDGPVELPKDPEPEPIVWTEEEEVMKNDVET